MTFRIVDYWMGRDALYPEELTPEIRAAASALMPKVNRFMSMFYAANPGAAQRRITSGWRPPAINRRVKNAAKKSNHMTGHAVDISDDDEALDTWAQGREGVKALQACGLWMEHRHATPRWAHFQDVRPGSGWRVFHP